MAKEEDAAKTEVKVKVEIIEDKVEEIRNSSVVDNMTESTYGESVQPIERVTRISKSMVEVEEEAKAEVETEDTIRYTVPVQTQREILSNTSRRRSV